MINDLSIKENIPENPSGASGEDDSRQMIEMAAEQLADLIWKHWLYIQKQKKKDQQNTPDS